MPGVNADPERIESFARDLAKFNARMSEEMKHLNGQFRALGDFWRDDQFRRYGEEYDASVRALQRFLTLSEQQIPALRKRARHLRDFLGQ